MNKNYPIQVVLRTGNFIVSHVKPAGGGNKDFYAGNDLAFVEHKNNLMSQLRRIRALQIKNEHSEICYAKLTVKPSALAKSHRPTRTLFNDRVSRVVGGGDLGEIFIELRGNSIQEVSEKLSRVESETTWIVQNEKKITKPSRLRSEVGAISEIRPVTASDKRMFSLDEGIEWLSDSRTGGAYIVELFEEIPPRQHWDNLDQEKRRLFDSFHNGLSSLKGGFTLSRPSASERMANLLSVKLVKDARHSTLDNLTVSWMDRRYRSQESITLDKEDHSNLIKFLEGHPLVKKVTLPPILETSSSSASDLRREQVTLPAIDKDANYPTIGVVDGGVSRTLGERVIDRLNFVEDADKDFSHGTFIAGLLVASSSLNGREIIDEPDGCWIVDLDALPKGDTFDNYYQEPLSFFEELRVSVPVMKARTGVRVFNMSLNMTSHASTQGYSLAAQILDEIGEENDVIFVISAGNTDKINQRPEWPEDDTVAIQILAASRDDSIRAPAESSRNICVSALNPPNMEGIVAFALSNYSCWGSSIRLGVKPDLAHIGGSGTAIPEKGYGLFSMGTDGNKVDDRGTSFAAPHVAKTLAMIDLSIDGTVSRETLLALLIHGASVPKPLAGSSYKTIAKYLVGYGIPRSAYDVLNDESNSITLVFANRIRPRQKMSFDFSWPAVLAHRGKCFGYAKLTLVASVPFDHDYGAEFIRANLEGYLRQEGAEGNFVGRLKPVHGSVGSTETLFEKNRIKDAYKWGQIKKYDGNFRGVGNSTNWRLEVEAMTRDREVLPENGIPFSAVLTISDPKNSQNVFDSMKQSLTSRNIDIHDIRTAAKILPRV